MGEQPRVDVASHMTGDPAVFAKGSLWLMALGVVGAPAAAATGQAEGFGPTHQGGRS